jgi:hypothetical protein
MIKGFKWILILVMATLLTQNSWAVSPKGKIVHFKRVEAADAYAPKVMGLFIGIQEYDDPYWHDLKYPRKDVADMEAFFSDSKTLKLDRKMVLTTPMETTRNHILNKTLPAFSISNTSPNDFVIVYISSHGTLSMGIETRLEEGGEVKEPKNIPYILTSDSREADIKKTAIPLIEMVHWFEKLKAERKVLILDMCHSGRFGKSQISRGDLEEISTAKGVQYKEIEDSKASIILAACPIGGISYEDDTLQNSVYTHFLLEGMQYGDLNLDGAVSISEAHNFAIDKTIQFTWNKKEYKQIPTAYSKVLGKDPILVSGSVKSTGNPTLFSFASGNQGVEMFLDQNYQGILPKGVPVEPGRHKVECKVDGEVVYSETIEVYPGYDYMLPDLTLHATKHSRTIALFETAYQTYSRDHVAKGLLPEGALIGVSLYQYQPKKKWLALSCGVAFGQESHTSQFSARAGVKYTRAFGQTRMFLGPDLVLSHFNYDKRDFSEVPDPIAVDDQMDFLSPGLEWMWVIPVEKATVMLGGRACYLPYEFDSEKRSVFSCHGVFSVGYTF